MFPCAGVHVVHVVHVVPSFIPRVAWLQNLATVLPQGPAGLQHQESWRRGGPAVSVLLSRVQHCWCLV